MRNWTSSVLLCFFLTVIVSIVTPKAKGEESYLETAQMVSVSTTITSPTTLLSPVNRGGSVYIMLHWSGSGTKPNGEYLLLSSASSGFSNSASTGTARIPAGNSIDAGLYLGTYNGPLYGVVIGTTSAQSVTVIRKK